jgi:outer membrane protein assembly factor BamB
MTVRKHLTTLSALMMGLLLAACSSGPTRQPTALGADPLGLAVLPVWSNKIGAINYPIQIILSGSRVAAASSDGNVAMLDVNTGSDIWRVSVGAGVTAGVGHDGETAALATTSNEILAVRNGAVLWRFRMPARVFTAPLVAGGRIFVLAADRSVTALDADTGRRLWIQNRTQSEALVLQQAGAIFAVGNTLVAGFAGRLVGMNPANGSTIWDAAFASSRATNDVERLIDVVGPVNRLGSSVCARAYQNAIACIDASSGQTVWTKPSAGHTGVGGDAKAVYGADLEGNLTAYTREKGEKLWSSDRYLYRDLTAAQATTKAVVFGDGSGYLHWVSRDSGQALTRMQIDNSAVLFSPVVIPDGRILAVTRSGVLAAVAAN